MPDLDPLSAPEIKLRGKTYRLPEMELKQVIPMTGRLLKLRSADHLSEEWLTLMFDVTFLTLTFLDPDITRDEFDHAPPSYPEMIGAFPVIMRQSRFIENVAKPPATETTVGEANAEGTTGTTS